MRNPVNTAWNVAAVVAKFDGKQLRGCVLPGHRAQESADGGGADGGVLGVRGWPRAAVMLRPGNCDASGVAVVNDSASP